MNDLRDLYEEVILDHNRNPRNYPRKPERTNHSAHGFNPVCGDEFFVHIHVDGGVIRDIGFDGAGCAISTASASLMTEALKDKPVAEAERLFRRVHDLLTEERQVGDPGDFLGKLTVLTGVKEYPMRVKCATLAWHTMRAALHDASERYAPNEHLRRSTDLGYGGLRFGAGRWCGDRCGPRDTAR